MQNIALVDIYADRWVACIRELPVVNADLTGADFALQVRLSGDQSGSPLISLGTVTTDVQGVRLISATSATIADHIAAGRLASAPDGYSETDTVMVSLLGIRIGADEISALPFPRERGDDIEFAWDILITPDGGERDKFAGGKFVVRAGVTQ